ncbi:fibroblast growth factor 22, transcript variant X1 [Ictidomys tridecemlineatus]|uniref:fibroblast growth factor 22 isoform X1 n=1 Tax=Ictidomys tridecemlineatus TaxID=43179 RepID=UPI000B544147|nr:fibroblast growth factor 22 isoform X1 [Ictidomys tridecemlineatus]KAG3280885.1 fibroblast growth factor 22, transcript variant X1 [Ictidomys tridecemlineatus]
MFTLPPGGRAARTAAQTSVLPEQQPRRPGLTPRACGHGTSQGKGLWGGSGEETPEWGHPGVLLRRGRRAKVRSPGRGCAAGSGLEEGRGTVPGPQGDLVLPRLGSAGAAHIGCHPELFDNKPLSLSDAVVCHSSRTHTDAIIPASCLLGWLPRDFGSSPSTDGPWGRHCQQPVLTVFLLAGHGTRTAYTGGSFSYQRRQHSEAKPRVPTGCATQSSQERAQLRSCPPPGQMAASQVGADCGLLLPASLLRSATASTRSGHCGVLPVTEAHKTRSRRGAGETLDCPHSLVLGPRGHGTPGHPTTWAAEAALQATLAAQCHGWSRGRTPEGWEQRPCLASWSTGSSYTVLPPNATWPFWTTPLDVHGLLCGQKACSPWAPGGGTAPQDGTLALPAAQALWTHRREGKRRATGSSFK